MAKLLEDEKLLFHQEASELERTLTEVKQQKVFSQRLQIGPSETV